MKRLYKSRSNKMLAGVCAGIGDYCGIDPTIVRIVFLILVIAAGLSLWVYIIAAIVIPEEPASGENEQKNEFNNEQS